MLGRRNLQFHIATIPDATDREQLTDRRRRRRHVHRRDPAARRRPRQRPQAAVDAAELRRGRRRRQWSRSAEAQPSTGVVHGTTVATNAVLERRGARDRARHDRRFRDVLELRRLRIPHMYDPFWRKPDAARPAPAALRGQRARRRRRRRSSGRSTTTRCAPSPAALHEAGVESVAVCLLHSYRYPEHEQRVGRSSARSCRRRRSRSRARSCASSASTSARRRRSSTPTCDR